MKKEINDQFIEGDTIIVTENADGRMYILRAKYIQDILDDWNGDCESVSYTHLTLPTILLV